MSHATGFCCDKGLEVEHVQEDRFHDLGFDYICLNLQDRSDREYKIPFKGRIYISPEPEIFEVFNEIRVESF
jgi:hypothetical protein